jgi:hypothetical protein
VHRSNANAVAVPIRQGDLRLYEVVAGLLFFAKMHFFLNVINEISSKTVLGDRINRRQGVSE